MPLYDFVCPHGHTFEKNVPIADRNEPVPCEGMVNQLADADTPGAWELEIETMPVVKEWMVRVPCILKAKRVEIGHSNPKAMLEYGLAANRDAAREGRYDPLRPSTRGVRK